MLVDDEEGILASGLQILSSLGYRAVGCPNGAEALTLFKENPHAVDLVLTDMTMPGMTGLELAENLMQIRPGLPIVLCTGFSEGLTSGAIQSAGIREMVMKPMIAHELAQVIHRAMHME